MYAPKDAGNKIFLQVVPEKVVDPFFQGYRNWYGICFLLYAFMVKLVLAELRASESLNMYLAAAGCIGSLGNSYWTRRHAARGLIGVCIYVFLENYHCQVQNMKQYFFL